MRLLQHFTHYINRSRNKMTHDAVSAAGFFKWSQTAAKEELQPQGDETTEPASSRAALCVFVAEVAPTASSCL